MPGMQWTIEVPTEQAENLCASLRRAASPSDQALAITAIPDGPLLAYNRAHPARAVATTDVVLSINGKTGDTVAIADEILYGGVLALAVERPLDADLNAVREPESFYDHRAHHPPGSPGYEFRLKNAASTVTSTRAEGPGAHIATRAKRWEVELVRDTAEDKLGARLIDNSAYLDVLVVEVLKVYDKKSGNNGMLLKHNAANPDAAVQAHDVLLSVNGVYGDFGRMLAELRADSVSLVVERPSERLTAGGTRWNVQVSKQEGERLGGALLATRECRDRKVLAVGSVAQLGPLAKFNATYPGRAVAINDLVISVNGVAGDALLMLDETMKGEINLLIERPSLEDAEAWGVSVPAPLKRAVYLSRTDTSKSQLLVPHIATRPRRWTVELTRESSERYGLRVFEMTEYHNVLVLGLKRIDTDGVLETYNKLHPESQVEVHDVLLSVNGVHGDVDRMLAEFDSKTVSIIVERPTESVVEAGTQWSVPLSKAEGESLGVAVFTSRQARDRSSLVVAAVTAGPVETHNSAHPSRAVLVNDVIISVNGIKDHPLAMLEELYQRDVELEVERPGLEEAKCWASALAFPRAVVTPPAPVVAPPEHVTARESGGHHKPHRASSARRWTITLSGGASGALDATVDAPPKMWTVKLTRRKGEKYGARVEKSAKYKGLETLQFTSIGEDGAIARHNAENSQDALEPFDIIVSVNGVKNDWRRMLAKFEVSEAVSVGVERVPGRSLHATRSTRSDISLGASMEASEGLPDIGTPHFSRFGAGFTRKESYYDYLETTVLGVQAIHPNGELYRYNERHPKSSVQVGDVLVSANGVHGDWDAMVAELAKDSVEVVLERPAEQVVAEGTSWPVDISKAEGERLGAGLFAARECRSKTVLAVSSLDISGPLSAFNLLHPERAVAVNDLILSINGLERDPLAMLDETLSGQVSLVIERPGPKERSFWAESVVDPSRSGTLQRQETTAEDPSRDHIASRAKRWIVELDRERGEQFGAHMQPNESYLGTLAMEVKSIDPVGTLARFNTLYPELAVSVHDVFVSANGIKAAHASWQRMLLELDRPKVCLVVERPSERTVLPGTHWTVACSIRSARLRSTI
jgi:hypothetical protein